jgi:hypothetical protein
VNQQKITWLKTILIKKFYTRILYQIYTMRSRIASEAICEMFLVSTGILDAIGVADAIGAAPNNIEPIVAGGVVKVGVGKAGIVKTGVAGVFIPN